MLHSVALSLVGVLGLVCWVMRGGNGCFFMQNYGALYQREVEGCLLRVLRGWMYGYDSKCLSWVIRA